MKYQRIAKRLTEATVDERKLTFLKYNKIFATCSVKQFKMHINTRQFIVDKCVLAERFILLRLKYAVCFPSSLLFLIGGRTSVSCLAALFW